MIHPEHFDTLEVRLYETRSEMGHAAGQAVVERIIEILHSQEEVRMIFAAAPSQNELLEYLVRHKEALDWGKVTAFHMDEYMGLDEGHNQLFASFLKRKLFDHLPFREVHLIDGHNPEETIRYGQLISEKPIDIVCLGIGENGHIAFNDPPVADFNDPVPVKMVQLDEECRHQQVNDGCFPSISDVPERAITLTIPALMSADHLFCVVPGIRKRKAVRNTLYQDISESCPASILRTHRSCILFLDKDAYPA